MTVLSYRVVIANDFTHSALHGGVPLESQNSGGGVVSDDKQ